MTLAEFLLARIAEDEQQITVCGPCDCHVEGLPLEHGYFCPVPRLADCAAKLSIVEEHPSVQYGHDGIAVACSRCSSWSLEGLDDETVPHPCPTLGFLAAVYSDHPDYQPEWKPPLQEGTE